MPSWFGLSSHSRRPSYSRTYSTSSRHSHSSHRSYSPSGSSYYKRRPRDGYISRLISKLKHLFRELWYYFRRNPVKAFVFVIMPLISGGVLAGFARQFGIRLPGFLMGNAARAGGGYYGSAGYGGVSGMSEGLGGLGKMAMGMGGAGGLGSLMSIAKNFM